MEYSFVVLAIVALFCKVEAQVCVNSGVPACSTPVVTTPQVLATTPVVATTVVDNSVSNALANALQLIIVADLIETRNGAQYIASLLNPCNQQPITEIVTPCGTPVEIISPCATPVTTPVEVISPCTSFIQPYSYLGACSEVVNPSISYVPSPNCPCATEVVNMPSYNNGCYSTCNQYVSPINTCNPCGVTEVISPCGPYSNGVLQVSSYSPCNSACSGNLGAYVTPCTSFGGITEVVQPCPSYCSGIPQVVPSPYQPGCSGIPGYVPFNPYGSCCQYFAPCPNVTDSPAPVTPDSPAPVTPDSPETAPANSTDTTTPPPSNPVCNATCFSPCYGTPNFIPNFVPNFVPNFCGPLAAEVVFPTTIPVTLNCNMGYTPSIGPCVNFDVVPTSCIAA